ncbi:DUF2845 domain-containing protein [Stutzerimonas decontaminans]|uniref:DUF2845 domain-containing protein n=1 Tax=Stutzerimonas stutzeri TaxID=316 RepID=A0A023WPC3_STUST|nr:DUF2845 domain-containing protein [Stutzerimonas decontaminans]AHY41634.1 hypothetical protein UIB01_03810 [Stutzerimonas decontaminans]
MGSKTAALILLAGALFGAAAEASMRCGTRLVHLGDTREQVEAKCGPADSQTFEEPSLRSDGVVQPGAVRIDRWAYGPRYGAHHHLRVIDGSLVEIRMERNP